MCKDVEKSLKTAREIMNAKAGEIHMRVALLQSRVKSRLKEAEKISKRIDNLERLTR